MCGVNSEDIDQRHNAALRGYLDHEPAPCNKMTVCKQFMANELPFTFLNPHTCLCDHWVQCAREGTNLCSCSSAFPDTATCSRMTCSCSIVWPFLLSLLTSSERSVQWYLHQSYTLECTLSQEKRCELASVCFLLCP